MGKRLLYQLILSFGLLSCALTIRAQEAASFQYTVEAEDLQGNAVAGLKVWVADEALKATDTRGQFTLTTEKPLRMPILAEIEDIRYELVQLAFFEEGNKVLLTVERMLLENEFNRLLVKNAEQRPVPDLVISLNGKPYRLSSSGTLALENPLTFPAVVELNNSEYKLYETHFSAEQHALYLGVEKLPEELIADDTLMQIYEADFDRIARQLQKERKVFEEKNEEIRTEILKIRDNLIKEEELSEEQKGELRNYLARMETAVEANNEALRQSEARTREALNKLKQIVSEKDSINLVAQAQILRNEQEKVELKARYREKVILFTGICLALLLLSLVIYLIAVKFQRQKHFLKEINSRLKATQHQLTRSIKELNTKRAEIEDHNQQLEVFVYKASHDIKGPLRSIMGLTEIGMKDVQDNAAQEYFDHIHRSTKRLDNLLMDLLKLTRTKQAVIEKQPVNLPAMIHEAIQSFSNSPNFDRIEFDLELEEGLQFSSDEKMLYSVIQNFVENGIKYADPEKETLKLKISAVYNPEEECLELSFEDNGLGIEKEHLPKIFDMFYKVNPQSDGTGLGLHIVKLTIEKLGGTMHVRSTQGKGSCFTIRFYEKVAVPA